MPTVSSTRKSGWNISSKGRNLAKGTTTTIALFLALSPNVSTPPPCTGRSSSRGPFLHLPRSSILLLGWTNAQMQLRLQSIDLTSQSFLLGSDAISMILGTDAKQKEATDRCCANYTQPPMSVIYNSPCKQSFRHSYWSNMVWAKTFALQLCLFCPILIS